jgi:hypothetical protein
MPLIEVATKAGLNVRESGCACAKLCVDEESTWYKSNRGIEQNIDGFCTKTTQKGGFSKLCVKIKKRCYTDLLHFSTRKHNLVFFFGRKGKIVKNCIAYY